MNRDDLGPGFSKWQETEQRKKMWDFRNFSKSEFECKCGCNILDKYEDNYRCMVIYFLQPLRTHTGRKIPIWSGIRCVKHNDKIPGAYYSYHTERGGNNARRPTAVDFWIEGLTWQEAEEVVKEHTDINFCGYHIYINSQGLWYIHIDFRGVKARW